MGASERDALLRERMRVMPPERFEQLVFELVRREYPDAVRLQHPDGGADTLRQADGERAAEVWQAKRYGSSINWGECQESLASSIKRWHPSKVVFCFARDLSQQLERSFKEKLAEHDDALAKEVQVLFWSQSELVRRLDENPDIKERYFADQAQLMEIVDRAVKAGGRIESGADLVERAKTLSEHAERSDVNFTYAVTSSSAEAPAPEWPKLPYLQMRLSGDGTQVEVVAWARPGADVEVPGFGFKDDESGERARAEAVRRWAAGETAVISEGTAIQFQVPVAMREFVPTVEQMLRAGAITIPAAQPFEVELEIETNDDRLSYTFDVRPVPPRPGEFGAVVGFIGDTFVEVAFALIGDGHARATFNLSASFGTDARASLETARLIRAWCKHERVTFRSTELYEEGIGGRSTDLPIDICDEMEWRTQFYADLVFLEEQLGVELPLPAEMTGEDVNTVGTMANILRTGEGTATFQNASGHVTSPHDIPGLPDQFRKLASMRKTVSYPLFGKEVELGEADYELPELKVVDIIPYGQSPTSPARVVLGADDDDQIRFRLVKRPPAE